MKLIIVRTIKLKAANVKQAVPLIAAVAGGVETYAPWDVNVPIVSTYHHVTHLLTEEEHTTDEMMSHAFGQSPTQ